MRIRPAIVLVVLILAACQSPPGSSSPSSAATVSQLPATGSILFGRYAKTTDEWRIFTIDPDGSNERELVLPGSNGGPRWSPDGTKLMAYAESPQGLLFAGTANADGSGWTILNSPDATLQLGCGAWSPDGLRLACEGFDETDAGRNGLYTVRASDGGDLTRLTSAPAGFHDAAVDYAPDGSRLLFGRIPLDEGVLGTSFSVNVDGTGLLEQPLAYGAGRWSPDGTGILVSNQGKLYLLDEGGNNAVAIEIPGYGGNAYGATWSPDGTQIAFSYIPSRAGCEGCGLFLMNRDGSGITRLTKTSALEEFADWSR